MSDFFCECADSGEPPCFGLVQLRADLAAAQEAIRQCKVLYIETIARAVRAEADLAAREAELAEVKAERVDWARRFLLDGHTPAQWKQRAEAAELAEKDAEYRVRARVLDLGAAMGRVERAEADRDEWKRKAEEGARDASKLREAAIALESEASKRLRFRDNERYPELCAALAGLRAAIAAKGE